MWAPFLLAIGFGLVVSATLHFIFLWPGQEPPEGPDGDDPAPGETEALR